MTDTETSTTINAYDNKYNWYALLVAILRPDISGYDAAATALGEPGTRGHGQILRGPHKVNKQEYDERAAKIYNDFIDGITALDLSIKYDLSINQVLASIRDYCKDHDLKRPTKSYTRHDWISEAYQEDCDRWS